MGMGLFLKTFCIGILIGMPIAMILVFIADRYDYHRDVKNHGKETADEIRKRWR